MEDLGYIYLSGKIAGLEYEVAKKIFDNAREKVHKLGYPYEKIINPFEIRTMDTFDWADYLIRDLLYLRRCNSIYLLRNWEDSPGAKVEKVFAEGLGITIVYEG